MPIKPGLTKEAELLNGRLAMVSIGRMDGWSMWDQCVCAMVRVGWMDGWVDGWMDWWMDGCLIE